MPRNSDSVPTMLLPGEYEVDADVLKKYGPDLIAALNAPHPYARPKLMVGEEDVNAYRPAIAIDCVVGTCSINNCLYPHCSPKGSETFAKITEKAFELKTGEEILADINAAFEAEFGSLAIPKARTAEERADIERYYDFIGQQMKGKSDDNP